MSKPEFVSVSRNLITLSLCSFMFENDRHTRSVHHFISLLSVDPRSPPTLAVSIKRIQLRHWLAGPWGDLTPWMLTKHKHPLESSPYTVHMCAWACTCGLHPPPSYFPEPAHPRYFFLSFSRTLSVSRAAYSALAEY